MGAVRHRGPGPGSSPADEWWTNQDHNVLLFRYHGYWRYLLSLVVTILEFLIIILIVSMLIYIHWNLLHHVRWWWLMVFNWTTWHENPVSNATLQHCAAHWLHIIQVTAHSHPHVTWPQSHEKFSTKSWEPRRDARWGEATLAFARVWPLSGYKYISKQSQQAGG